MAKDDLCQFGWNGIADLGEFRFDIADWLEVFRKGLDSSALAPGQASGLLKDVPILAFDFVIVLAGKIPSLLPTIGEI